ncbi:MAG: MerR family transcriptional regulator [Gemmatimonadales bacterium]
MSMTIGEVARSAEVGVETIRYYERQDLIPSPPRTRSGYRQYSADAVDRIRFIRHAKDLGFTLNEIKELLELRVQHESSCHAVREKALHKIQAIRRRIDDLEKVRGALANLVEACDMNETTSDCPILDSLDVREER